MIEEIFHYRHVHLLRKFIELEALDYRKYGNRVDGLNEKGKEFCKQLEEKIVEEIKSKFSEGFDWCNVNSFGNAGSMEQSISIYGYGKYWNWRKPSISINLCICGHIDHWGSITEMDKK
jgi:hypothetical protein